MGGMFFNKVTLPLSLEQARQRAAFWSRRKSVGDGRDIRKSSRLTGNGDQGDLMAIGYDENRHRRVNRRRVKGNTLQEVSGDETGGDLGRQSRCFIKGAFVRKRSTRAAKTGYAEDHRTSRLLVRGSHSSISKSKAAISGATLGSSAFLVIDDSCERWSLDPQKEIPRGWGPGGPQKTAGGRSTGHG